MNSYANAIDANKGLFYNGAQGFVPSFKLGLEPGCTIGLKYIPKKYIYIYFSNKSCAKPCGQRPIKRGGIDRIIFEALVKYIFFYCMLII